MVLTKVSIITILYSHIISALIGFVIITNISSQSIVLLLRIPFPFHCDRIREVLTTAHRPKTGRL